MDVENMSYAEVQEALNDKTLAGAIFATDLLRSRQDAFAQFIKIIRDAIFAMEETKDGETPAFFIGMISCLCTNLAVNVLDIVVDFDQLPEMEQNASIRGLTGVYAAYLENRLKNPNTRTIIRKN